MATSLIERYCQAKDPAAIAPGFLAYLANLECVARVAPEVARSIVQELADQRRNIKLIASENYSSHRLAVRHGQPPDRQVRRRDPPSPVLRRLRQR